MFTSLQTLRTHSLHFQYDVSNVPSHTEHVKRSLETSKIEKKGQNLLIWWFCGYHKEKKSCGKHIFKGNQYFSKFFQQHFSQLKCKINFEQLVKTFTWRGETSIFVFFWSRGSRKRSSGAKIQSCGKNIFKGNQYFSKPFQQHFSQLKCKK